MEKIKTFEELCKIVSIKIKRNISKEEKKSLAFILERKFAELESSKNLLEKLFEIEEVDSPTEVCLKIHWILNKLLKKDYEEIYLGFFPEETDFLRKYRNDKYSQLNELAQNTFSYAKQSYLLEEITIPLIGVQDFLLPKWFIQYCQQFDL